MSTELNILGPVKPFIDQANKIENIDQTAAFYCLYSFM